MPRPKTDDDAMKNLRPEDERQTAPKGTKIGKLRRSEVFADFRKIVRRAYCLASAREVGFAGVVQVPVRALGEKPKDLL